MSGERARCPQCDRPLSAEGGLAVCAECLLRSALAADDPDHPIFPATNEVARRIGDYEVLEQIGRGGMAVVFKARQLSLNRLVALKVITAGEFASPDAVRRFQAEAEATARLEHPNIVPIYETGQQDGQNYLSMKLVPGGTLSEQLANRGDAPPGLAVLRGGAALIVKVARAAHYAHQRGILHRDIKPGNILMDAEGEPHLSDFGLAKLLEKESSLTQSLAVLGTPSYMAPEQAAGDAKNLTTAADIYGLGAVLYELVTGAPPFAAATSMETVRHVLEKAPRRPCQLNKAVNKDLETICLKTLEKEPQRRYESALALAEDLERWLRQETIWARPTPPPERLAKWVRRHPTLASLTSLTAVSLVGFIITLVVSNARIATSNRTITGRAEAERAGVIRLKVAATISDMEAGDWSRALLLCADAMRMENNNTRKEVPHRYRFASLLAQMPVLEQIWFHEGEILTAEFSPAGDRVLTASTDKTARVWDVQTGAPLTPPLRHPSAVECAVFSPDGTMVASVSREMARVWDARTGAPLTSEISLRGGGRQVCFSPDSKWILTPNGTSAQRWSVATGEALGAPLAHGDGEVSCVTISSDGQWVATGADRSEAYVWEVQGSRLAHRLPQGGDVRTVAFSPGGGRLAVADSYNQGRIWEVASGRLLQPCLLVRDHMLSLSFSPNGKRLLAPGFDGAATVWDGDSLLRIPGAIQHQDVVASAQWSVGGGKIATASWDRTARIWDAATLRADSPMLRHSSRVHIAAFSPGEDRVVTGDRNGVVRLWCCITNSGARLTLRHTEPIKAALLSRDQTRVITGDMHGKMQVWDRRSGQPVGDLMVTSGWVSWALLARDDKHMVVRSRLSFDVWDVDARQLKLQWVGTNLGTGLQVTADGQRVVVTYSDRTARIWSLPAGLPVTPPLRHDEELVHPLAFSSDGARVALLCADNTIHVWDTTTGRRVAPPIQAPAGALRVAFSPEGARLALAIMAGGELSGATQSAVAQIWDIATGQPVTAMMTHEGPISAMAFTPDGRKIITGSWDTTARVWAADTGAPLTPPMRHGRLVNHLVLDRAGECLLVSSGNDHARLWDVATGEPLTLPLRHNDQVFRSQFSSDEREVVTASGDNGARVFPIAPVKQTVEELTAKAQLIASHRLDASQAMVPLDNEELRSLWESARNPRSNSLGRAGLSAGGEKRIAK